MDVWMYIHTYGQRSVHIAKLLRIRENYTTNYCYGSVNIFRDLMSGGGGDNFEGSLLYSKRINTSDF